VVDFALALGRKVCAGAHAERGGDHAGEAGKENIFAVAGGGAGDAGNDAEDGAEAVVDAVDGVADPTAGLFAALVALGEEFIENILGVDFGGAGRCGIVPANERSQLPVVILLILNDVIEDGDGALVAEGFELLAVVGYMAALLDFQAPQGHAHAAGAVGQRVRLAVGAAGVDGLRTAEFEDAAVPQSGVLPLGAGKVTQHLGANRVGVAFGKGQVGVMALHLSLPVAFQGRQNLLQPDAAQRFLGHVSLLASL